MYFQILQPAEVLLPYITRYVFVRAEGSTDTMAPPTDDPRFVNGKHVQPLLPNYGSLIFMRNVETEICGTHTDGLTLIDAFFIGHLPHKMDVHYARLRRVIAACDEAKGNISAAEMASVACLGERQFLRVFRTYVGIPPKQFIRLRRFHRTIQTMQQTAAKGQPIDLMTVALQHGYYDLSHMALEFQQMGCVSPSQFRMLGIPLTSDFSVFFA